MFDLRATIGDWSASMGGTTDVNGCEWTINKFTGWHDSLSVRAEPIPRPSADGVWDGLPTQDSRVITFEGQVWAPNSALLFDAVDRIGSLLATAVRYDTLVVYEEDRELSRQARVRLGGATLTQVQSQRIASWSMSLYAPDPKRYSATLHSVSVQPFAPGAGRSYDLTFPRTYGALGSSGLVEVTNSGTRDTPVLFRVATPVTNPLIRLAGAETMQVMIDVPAGLSLEIDTGERSVLLGGVSRRQLMSKDDFFLLPPGTSTIYYATDAGGDPLTIEWRDAW